MTNQKGILISCLKATQLIEKKKIVGLSIFDRFKLGLHTGMCKVCKSYSNIGIFTR